jgi:hypothetical protein
LWITNSILSCSFPGSDGGHTGTKLLENLEVPAGSTGESFQSNCISCECNSKPMLKNVYKSVYKSQDPRSTKARPHHYKTKTAKVMWSLNNGREEKSENIKVGTRLMGLGFIIARRLNPIEFLPEVWSPLQATVHLCGIFYLPWHRCSDKGPRFLVSSDRPSLYSLYLFTSFFVCALSGIEPAHRPFYDYQACLKPLDQQARTGCPGSCCCRSWFCSGGWVLFF